MKRFSVPRELKGWIPESHTHTWFSVDGLGLVVETHRGPRRGDPLADMFFNFLYSKIMCRVVERLRFMEMLCEIPFDSSHRLWAAVVELWYIWLT